MPKPARQRQPFVLDLLQLLAAQLVHDVGLERQRRPSQDLAAVALLAAWQLEQPERLLRPRQVATQHLQEPGVGGVDLLTKHLDPARPLLVGAAGQRSQRGTVGYRCRQQPFDLPSCPRDHRLGGHDAGGEPVAGIGRQRLQVGGERGQPSQVGGALGRAAMRLLERDRTQQQPRPVAVADRHVPDRPQPVHVVREGTQLTTRRRHRQSQRSSLLRAEARHLDTVGGCQQPGVHPIPLRTSVLTGVRQGVIEPRVADHRREQRLDGQEPVPVRPHDPCCLARHVHTPIIHRPFGRLSSRRQRLACLRVRGAFR
jgi:hypothetical protein